MPRKLITCVCGGCGTSFKRPLSDIARGRSRWCSTRCFYARSTRTKHPYYALWQGMRQRCNNPREKQYYLYGGRGINVCPEWEASFEQFVADMGERPTPEHTVERKDVNGDYCPENCVWATPYEQAQNRRTNRYLTHDGRTQTIAAWAKEVGLSSETLRNRIRYGWSIEEALNTHPLPHGKQSTGKRPGPKTPRSGEAHPGAKLTVADVRTIRLRCAAGETHRSIAAEFRISPSTVSQIMRGKNWRSLED